MKKLDLGLWAKRIGAYVLGLFIMTLGISISIKSDLGVSPVSSLPLVLGTVSGVEVGTMTAIVFCFYVLLQLPLLGKRFGIIQILEVPCAILFGKFVTLSGVLISGWVPGSYIERLAMCALSIFLIAFGLKLYLLANIVPQAGDGLVLVISEKFGWKMANVKNGFDITSISLAALISLACTGGIVGLREGTVLAALGVGRVVALLERYLGKTLRTVIYGPKRTD